VILRLESGLFFANADALGDAIRAHAAERSTRAVVLDAETLPYVDVTAARMLTLLSSDLQQQGVRLVVARDVGQVRDVLRRGVGDRPLPAAYPTVQDAVQALRQGLSASDGARRPRRPSTSSPGSPRPC
jgi:sulfate permease, SulP family